MEKGINEMQKKEGAAKEKSEKWKSVNNSGRRGKMREVEDLVRSQGQPQGQLSG